MPFTRDKRREYDAKRRISDDVKEKNRAERAIAKPRKILFNMMIDANWLAFMQRLAIENVATGRYPWKTTQDVARAMFARGFASINDDDTADEFMPEFRLQQQLADDDRRRSSAQNIFAMAKLQIDALLRIHTDDDALDKFRYVLGAAQALPATIWSMWLLTELKREYPTLWERAQKEPRKGIRQLKGRREQFQQRHEAQRERYGDRTGKR